MDASCGVVCVNDVRAIPALKNAPISVEAVICHPPPPPPRQLNITGGQRLTTRFYNGLRGFATYFSLNKFTKKQRFFQSIRRSGGRIFGYAQCALFAPAKTPFARICQNYPVPPYSKDFQMKRFAILFAALFSVVGAVGAVAQSDTAYIPFVVDVNAIVRATPNAGTTAVVAQVQMTVSANTQKTLKIPLPKTSGVLSVAQRQASVPAVISNGGGKVTLNLPSQSYKNAEIALYSVNGKRILRKNVSASSAGNAISRKNAAPGAYLLSVAGMDGTVFSSRLTHSGGRLDINVTFGDRSHSSARQLAKDAANGDWTIIVMSVALEYSDFDIMYTLNPAKGENPLQNITFLVAPGFSLSTPTNVTAMAASASSITVSWSAVSGATDYYVYRATSATGTYSRVGSAPSTTYTNTGLTTGTTYYYKVSSYNGSTESPQSAYASATIEVISGTFIDYRDDKTYKYVTIVGIRRTKNHEH
jgi:hypothetical protein